MLALGEGAQTALDRLARTQQSRTTRVKKRRDRKDAAGPHALLEAKPRALRHQALGVHSLANLLAQERTPQRPPPPVRLQPAHLNQLRLAAPALAASNACGSRRTTR